LLSAAAKASAGSKAELKGEHISKLKFAGHSFLESTKSLPSMTEIEVFGAHHPREAEAIQRTVCAIERTTDLLRLTDALVALMLPQPPESAKARASSAT